MYDDYRGAYDYAQHVSAQRQKLFFTFQRWNVKIVNFWRCMNVNLALRGNMLRVIVR